MKIPDTVKMEAKKIGINLNRQMMKDADELEKKHKSAAEYNAYRKEIAKDRETLMNT